MPRKLKWLPFAISLCLLTSACTPSPPDVPACEHLGQRLATDPVTGHLLLTPSPTCMKQIGEPECGHCVYIVSGKESFLGEKEGTWLNGKPWSKLRAESVYLPAKESFAPVATYIINSCRKMGCNGELERFRIRLRGLKAAVDNLDSGP